MFTVGDPRQGTCTGESTIQQLRCLLEQQDPGGAIANGANSHLEHRGIGITTAKRNDFGCHHPSRILVGG
jgi:hypothetical protein